MMYSLIVSTVLVAVVSSAAVTTGAEVKPDAGAAHYGGYQQQAPPQQSLPQYAAPTQYPIFQYPNFDVNYCSVHAGFPLIGIERRHRDRHNNNRDKRQASYGVPAQDPSSSTNTFTQTFNNQAFGPAFFQRPRHFERQGCRNTAIFSHKSCNHCCQISSRATGVATPTVGLLLAFDPQLTADKKHDKNADINEGDRAVQCVCCTTRKLN